MTEPTMTRGADANSVRKVVSIQAPQAVAWRVFTGKMGTWWPLAYYKIGKANAVDAVIEPRVGGRWYERGDDGSTCQWGAVDTDDMRAVLAAGASRQQFEDALAVCFSFNVIGRLADAFGFFVPGPNAFEAGARYLLARGYR
jgi:hypothetical protein